MEIQRYGNGHLEIILDDPTPEGQKHEIAALDTVIRNWKDKCEEAETCSVCLLCRPGQASDLIALAEKTVNSLDNIQGVAVDFDSTDIEKPAKEDPEAAADLGRKKSHLKDVIMLALVDGLFDGNEQQMVVDIGIKMGLSERMVNSIYNESILNPDQIPSIPPQDPQERLQHLADLCRIILSDGIIADWESVLIIPLAVNMGFDSDDVARMLQEMIDGESA